MASGETTKSGIPVPRGSDPTNIPDDMASALDFLDGLIATATPLASLPAAGKFGRIVRRTGDGTYWFDNGSGFDLIPQLDAHGSDISLSKPGDTAAAGDTGYAADAGHRHAREPGFGDWTLIPLATGFTPLSSGVDPAYRTAPGGSAELSGIAAGNILAQTGAQLIGTLPSGRPLPGEQVQASGATSNTTGNPTVERIQIMPDGTISVVSSAPHVWVSLDGIRFRLS